MAPVNNVDRHQNIPFQSERILSHRPLLYAIQKQALYVLLSHKKLTKKILGKSEQAHGVEAEVSRATTEDRARIAV